MRVFGRLVYKDILVLIRDSGGLAMLFLMPMALVLIMTSLQNNTFKAINESGIKLIMLNQDEDSLGTAIEKEIASSEFFMVSYEIGGKVPDEKILRDAVASGDFQVGVVIPAHATALIRERVKENVTRIFSEDTVALTNSADSAVIMMYLDPATKNSLRSTLQGSIREFASRVESRIVLNELTSEINSQMGTTLPDLNSIRQETVVYREEYVAANNMTVIPNSVQHNVPAWTLFAMFFIVIPFASSMIREREDGTLPRLLTMPCPYQVVMLSKTAVYLLVCFLQFMLIMFMGVYLFPLLGLPALDIEGRLGNLSVVAAAAALAAIGYGIAVGTFASTHQQAAIFASISVVILAAIGGIWVPVFIMPPFLREISIISPMNWGMKGFYDILVRNSDLSGVAENILWLILFAAGCLLVALWYQKNLRDAG
jgi:ABC-2 type transport system permease protein